MELEINRYVSMNSGKAFRNLKCAFILLDEDSMCVNKRGG